MEEILKMIRDYCDEQETIVERNRDIYANKEKNRSWPDYKSIYSLNGMILAYEDVIEAIELIALENGIAIDEEEEK